MNILNVALWMLSVALILGSLLALYITDGNREIAESDIRFSDTVLDRCSPLLSPMNAAIQRADAAQALTKYNRYWSIALAVFVVGLALLLVQIIRTLLPLLIH